MTVTFDSLPWHDAALLEVSVDRRNPGKCDEVRLRIAWPQGEEATMVFRDCYAMNADMNFGIIAEERIASAKLDNSDPSLASIRERWNSVGVSLEPLSCYLLEMSSTGSAIRIYAMKFEIQELTGQ